MTTPTGIRLEVRRVHLLAPSGLPGWTLCDTDIGWHDGRARKPRTTTEPAKVTCRRCRGLMGERDG